MSGLVIATDLSESALNAARVGLELATKLDLTPTIVYVDRQVLEVSPALLVTSAESLADIDSMELEKNLKKNLLDHIKKLNLDKFQLEVWKGNPSDGILKSVSRHGAKMIVTGLRGHSFFKEVFVGSVAQRLFEISPVPVFGVHDSLNSYPKHPVYCCDFLKSNTSAHDMAEKLANGDEQIKLDVLHIVCPTTVVEIQEKNTEVNSLEEALEKVNKIASIDIGNVASSFKAETRTFVNTSKVVSVGISVLEHVEVNNNDLVIMGSHGHTGMKKWLMGSTAEYIIKRAERSVVVCR